TAIMSAIEPPMAGDDRTGARRTAILNALIAAGADVNATDAEGREVPEYIFHAWSPAALDLVPLLRRAGATWPFSLDDVLSGTMGYEEHNAEHYGHQDYTIVSYLRALVEHGASVNVHSAYMGSTILHWAAGAGDLDLMEYLLRRGADLKAREKY